ncbi:MAG: hypothetical protein QW714_00940 [Nanopusillaceae archaeon]
MLRFGERIIFPFLISKIPAIAMHALSNSYLDNISNKKSLKFSF